MPPRNSEKAAAESQNHAGRMKPSGVVPEMYVVKPGPLKVPRTFCEPWAIMTAASAKRIGTVIQVGEVAMIRRNMREIVTVTLPGSHRFVVTSFQQDYRI